MTQAEPTDLRTLTDVREQLDESAAGGELHALMAELFPILRSITGQGFRDTLEIIGRRIPDLVVEAVPSGTIAFDWTVPPEWTIRDAYVRGPSGEKVIDLAESSLHVVSYSVPVHERMSLQDLTQHLHTIPELPDWIPYRTSYYAEDWGFCLRHRDFEALPDGEYEVHIDSSLDEGVMNYGELVLPGTSDREVLLSAHACHPAMCNDNLSGVVVATKLAELLAAVERRFTYRILFAPGGVGSILWMSRNVERLDRIAAGLVLTCLGDPGPFTYKLTQRGDTLVDQAVLNALRNSGQDHSVIDFSPYGYDERNYGSPRFDLPVGSLQRTPHAKFPEYHTSGDDLDFVQADSLGGALMMYLNVIDALERNHTYRNLIPEAEPQLGKRGLYGLKGGLQDRAPMEVALLWVMNQSDGNRSLLDISDRSGIPFDVVAHAAELLLAQDLLEKVDTAG